MCNSYQCWTKENLKTSKYADGSSIANITDNTAWTNTSGGAWCWYKDSAQYEPTYGKLYNWAVANDSRNVCPIGWHVPSKAEWEQLIDYVGGKNTAAGHLKEAGTAHWNTDSGTDNSSGFAALPGGGRSESGGGFVYFIRNQGLWWSSTPSSTTNAYQVDIQTNYNYLQYPLLGRGNAAGLSRLNEFKMKSTITLYITVLCCFMQFTFLPYRAPYRTLCRKKLCKVPPVY